MKRHMLWRDVLCFFYKNLQVTFASEGEAEPPLFLACS